MSHALGPNPVAMDLDAPAHRPLTLDPALSPHPEPAAAAHAEGRHSAFSDFNEMTKPRITALVVATAYIGYQVARYSQIGAAHGAPVAWWCLPATLGGTALACMGASVFNQVLERDIDALMHRTRNRPLPSRRRSPAGVAALGITLSVAGVALMLALTTPLAAALTAFTVLSYAFVYTPLKRVSSVCTIVGAVPGAMPPLLGYAAAAGRVDAPAWAMFAILFLWQLPHFLAIAWLYRDDYARAGLPMLPVVDPDFSATSRQVLAGCLALLPLGLMPTVLGFTGMVYLVGALLAGLGFLGFGVALVRGRTRTHARALFFASLVYLPLVFALMLFDMV